MNICTATASAPRRRCHETTRSAIVSGPDAIHGHLWLLQHHLPPLLPVSVVVQQVSDAQSFKFQHFCGSEMQQLYIVWD